MATNNRLTKAIRESLAKDLMNYAFFERVTAAMDAERAFATEVFDAIFPTFDKDRKKLPENWFPQDDDFKISFDGTVARLSFVTGTDYSVPSIWRKAGLSRSNDNCKRRFPYHAHIGGVIAALDKDHELSQKHKDIVQTREALIEEMEKAFRTMNATLASVGTISKLVDVWPEARVFAERYKVDGEQKAILPAIPRAELNDVLGLPPQSDNAVAGGEVVA